MPNLLSKQTDTDIVWTCVWVNKSLWQRSMKSGDIIDSVHELTVAASHPKKNIVSNMYYSD